MQLHFQISTDHQHPGSHARLRIQARPFANDLDETIDNIADIELNRLDARNFGEWLYENMDAILHEEPPAFLPSCLTAQASLSALTTFTRTWNQRRINSATKLSHHTWKSKSTK